jgi:hypothetical protein
MCCCCAKDPNADVRSKPPLQKDAPCWWHLSAVSAIAEPACPVQALSLHWREFVARQRVHPALLLLQGSVPLSCPHAHTHHVGKTGRCVVAHCCIFCLLHHLLHDRTALHFDRLSASHIALASCCCVHSLQFTAHTNTEAVHSARASASPQHDPIVGHR